MREMFVDENEIYQMTTEPVKTGEGIIEYRKYLYALKYLERKLEETKNYKDGVLHSIEVDIEKQNENIQNLKNTLKAALATDPVAEKTKSGGFKIKLPDIATVSLSKPTPKVKWQDEKAVLDALGEEFGKVEVKLDKTKAKEAVLASKESVAGTEVTEERRLTIRY